MMNSRFGTEFFNHFDQGTEAWHEMRFGRIGGSTSKSLHVKGDTLLNNLMAAQMEPFEMEDSFQNAAMARGNELEPEARKAAGMYLGLDFEELGYAVSDKCDLLGFSPDGITEDLRDVIEIKCPSAAVHTKYVREGIVPLDYAHQVVHAFTVIPDVERVHFVSFRPECSIPLFVKTVHVSDYIDIGTPAKPNLQLIDYLVAEKIALAKSLQDRIFDEISRVNSI